MKTFGGDEESSKQTFSSLAVVNVGAGLTAMFSRGVRLLRFTSHAEPPKSKRNSEPIRDARVALGEVRRYHGEREERHA